MTVERLKYENKDLNRQLAEGLATAGPDEKPTPATAKSAPDAPGIVPVSDAGDKPAPPTAIQDSVAP